VRILFVNTPNTRVVNGQLWTGPSSGSRWPFSMHGEQPFHGYAPWPVDICWTIAYLRHHGFEADLYDGVALCHADLNQTRDFIYNYRPSIAVFDIATPVYDLCNEMALWTKQTIESKIVYCGSHMKVFGDECKKQSWVDHVIKGETEIPMLDIARRYPGGDGVYSYQHLDQINTLPDGSNFMPHRDWSMMGHYYDPSMQTPRTQVQLVTSRSCSWACTFCTTSRVYENAKFRVRSAEMMIDEIRTIKHNLGDSLGSFFVDDETYTGDKRIVEMCKGFKEAGVPWSMMSRLDAIKLETYDAMVDAGLVGIRLGVESWDQQSCDNVKKNLDTTKALETAKTLISRYKGLEFHFTSMTRLPGSTPENWKRDDEIFQELIALGRRHGNVVHRQVSGCQPFPGTELWQELVDLGHGEKLKDFKMYNGHLGNDQQLIEIVGVLGRDYRAKPSKFSGMGEPVGNQQ
jgi:radical SAM superfamily enzyme YgiQ (UPF0313 family)